MSLIFSNSSNVYWTETTAFDLSGRPLVIQHPFDVRDEFGAVAGGNALSTVSYDGLSSTTINAKGQEKTEVVNLAGEVVSVTNAQSKTVTYEYDVYGKLVLMRDPAANETIIHYNALGQKEWMDDPDKGYWSYQYNRFGDLLCQINANNQVVKSEYDFKGPLSYSARLRWR